MTIKNFDKKAIVAQFGASTNDTGSPAVQIAILTAKIKYMTEHMIANPKDYSARLSLIITVNKRTKLLQYLKGYDASSYEKVISVLNLKRK